jgi:transcriptional regulator with PAS, ATPase and Fis domain
LLGIENQTGRNKENNLQIRNICNALLIELKRIERNRFLYPLSYETRMDIQTVKQRFGIIGHSNLLEHALKTAVQVAPTDLTVLVTGESGVGKESFSKIIHSLSARKHNNFIAINCGALPESTINSELFGHTKGAFTGAVGDRKGYFETVNGGTIFLDEIGEMPLDTQTFLLRVLEQGEFVKVGSSVVEKTDVRVIAATNVNLMERIRQGKFREDLYYRLSTVVISVPALRERGDDVQLLFRKFVTEFAEQYRSQLVRLDDIAQQMLQKYTWPGNIRELRNVAKRVALFAEDKVVTADELLRFLPDAQQNNLPIPAAQYSSGSDNPYGQGFYEREILFKFLYDMKKDLNDMKALIAELARTNNLQMPGGIPSTAVTTTPKVPSNYIPEVYEKPVVNTQQSFIINQSVDSNVNSNGDYGDVEEIEESLSMDQMEKELIERALKKHRGRRKEAAKELRISERTLYRKIKLYDIEM